jgi:hypothetical protein
VFFKIQYIIDKIIVLKPGSAWRVNPGPADLELEPGWVEKKIDEEKTGVTRQPGQKPGCNPLTFLLKRHRFDLKKIDQDDPVTRSKPGTRALDRAGSENYG